MSKFHSAATIAGPRRSEPVLAGPGFKSMPNAERAAVELPDQIQWSDAAGLHAERLPMEPTIGELLNDHFYRLVTGETLARPDDPRRLDRRPARERPRPEPRDGLTVPAC